MFEIIYTICLWIIELCVFIANTYAYIKRVVTGKEEKGPECYLTDAELKQQIQENDKKLAEWEAYRKKQKEKDLYDIIGEYLE